LVLRSGFSLALFFVFASAAIAIKSEGMLELILDLAILSVAAWRWRRSLLWLWATALAALATSVPWFAWRAAHGISNVFSLHNALSPSYLGRHTDLLHGSLHVLGDHFTSVREWSLIGAARGLARADRRDSGAPDWSGSHLQPFSSSVTSCSRGSRGLTPRLHSDWSPRPTGT